MADVQDEWEEAARAYDERFGDVFPLMQFGGDIPDAIEEVRRCLESGEPYWTDPGLKY